MVWTVQMPHTKAVCHNLIVLSVGPSSAVFLAGHRWVDIDG